MFLLLAVYCTHQLALFYSTLAGQQQGLWTGQTAAALRLLLPGQLRQAASSSTAAQAAVTAAQGEEASEDAAERALGTSTAAGAPAAHAAALHEDVWPLLHTPVDPGAAELAARFVQEQVSVAAEPADAGSAPGAASAPCTGAAGVGQPPDEAAEGKAIRGGAAAAGSPSPLAALQERLKQAGQSKAGTKVHPCPRTAAKARQALSVSIALSVLSSSCCLSVRMPRNYSALFMTLGERQCC